MKATTALFRAYLQALVRSALHHGPRTDRQSEPTGHTACESSCSAETGLHRSASSPHTSGKGSEVDDPIPVLFHAASVSRRHLAGVETCSTFIRYTVLQILFPFDHAQPYNRPAYSNLHSITNSWFRPRPKLVTHLHGWVSDPENPQQAHRRQAIVL